MSLSIELDFNYFFKNRLGPRFDSMVQLNVDPEVRDELKELLVKGGRPIIYGNHQSHGDGWMLAQAVGCIRGIAWEAGTDIPGFVLPVAKSIFSGHQGLPIKILTELSLPIFEEKGLKVFPYTRKKDEDKYGLKGGISEILPMGQAVRNGYGFAYLPEASVQGGRHKNIMGLILGGERFGIIEPDNQDGFSNVYDLMKRFGNVRGEIFFLPVAMEGGYRFFAADLPLPTKEMLLGLLRDTTNPAQVTIERPIGRERLIREFGEDWRERGSNLNYFLMTKVARRLPPESRGIYKDVVELDIAA